MKPKYISIGLLLLIIAVLGLAFSFSGCTTAGKATQYFDAHADTAAGYCAVRYPIKTDSVVTVRTDSSGYKAFVDSTKHFTDSLLIAAQDRYNDNRAALLTQVNALQAKGDYSESVAQQLADEINAMHPPDTAGLRASIEAQIRATLHPCADSILAITKQNTAALAAETAIAEKYKVEALLYEAAITDPATLFGLFFAAVFKKWYFWTIIGGVALIATRKLWMKLII